MAYWLLKSEPDEFSIHSLEEKRQAPWDGVRNYQARNFIAQMQIGDLCFFYHSSCKAIGIAGIMAVTSLAYPDPLSVDESSPYFDIKSTKNNKWLAIDMKHVSTLNGVLSLAEIKKLAASNPELSTLSLVQKGSRLSVMPVSDTQWRILSQAANQIL